MYLGFYNYFSILRKTFCFFMDFSEFSECHKISLNPNSNPQMNVYFAKLF